MKTNKDYIIDNSIFRIGSVVSVEGRTIRISVDKGKNTSHILYKGDILQNISVGGYIKISKGFIEMIAKIEGESVTESKDTHQKGYMNNKEKINRVLSVKLLGYIENGKFTRGIKELPLIDNECYLLTREEFNLIHNFVDKKDVPLEIGKLSYDDGQIINIGVNSIFASHIGIFGNTGSGKSYTLAKLYKTLFDLYKENSGFVKKSKFYFIDFNGEYTGDNVMLDKEYKNIYKLSTGKNTGDKYPIDLHVIKDPVFWSIFLDATEKTQTPFLKRAIENEEIKNCLFSIVNFHEFLKDRVFSATSQTNRFLENTVIIDFFYQLGYFLNNSTIRQVAKFFQEKLSGGNDNIDFFIDTLTGRHFASDPLFKQTISDQINTITIPDLDTMSEIKKIGLSIIIKYYDEIIRGFANREHLGPLLKRLEKRINDMEKVIEHTTEQNISAKNITIFSLRDVNIDIRKMLPMLICKDLYEKKKEAGKQDESLHIIIDEAHNILSKESERESEQWKDYRLETFEEIIKEGRKFGVFLTIASQRPSDISSTIISQLHNYFLHRLINNNDIIAVEKTIAYLDKVSAESLPILPTGTCILAGLFAQIPIVISVNEIEESFKPNNGTIKLTNHWEHTESIDTDIMTIEHIPVEYIESDEFDIEDLPF